MNKMSEDEAIKQLQYLKNRKIGCGDWLINCKDRQAIETILAELEKKDKIINAMALQLSGISIWDDTKEEPIILMTEEEVKEYFEQEVKDE